MINPSPRRSTPDSRSAQRGLGTDNEKPRSAVRVKIIFKGNAAPEDSFPRYVMTVSPRHARGNTRLCSLRATAVDLQDWRGSW